MPNASPRRIHQVAVLVCAVVLFSTRRDLVFAPCYLRPLDSPHEPYDGHQRVDQPVWQPRLPGRVPRLVLAYTLALVSIWARANNPFSGAALGLFLGVGIVAASALPSHLFENPPLELFAIDPGFNLLAMFLMGGVLGAWRKYEPIEANPLTEPFPPLPSSP